MAYAMQGNAPRPKKIYIATRAFNNDFWSYSVTGPTAANLTTTGRLALLSASNSAVTAVTCPAGRLLREIGASLYPGVNPGLKVGETNYNASAGEHRWVKVYDAITGFNGYIDPNGASFATYSTDRPEEFADINESNGSGTRLGQSVYTAGNVTTLGNTTLPLVSFGTLGAGANIYDFGTTPGTYYTTTAATSVSNIVPYFNGVTAAPPAGRVITIIVYGVASAAAVTFTTPFRPSATAAPAAATNRVSVTFVSDGTNLIEVSRASV